MRCIRTLKASYNKDYTRITYSRQDACRDIPPWDFECRKCLACRLNNARDKAIRCMHEASMHEDNIFLTLTYNDENLESPFLIYEHFQTFIRALRDKYPEKKIPYMVTGEYGDKTKRPHWHAIIFNYRPVDAVHKYTTDYKEPVFTSEEITKLWNRGNIEFGSVSIDSAGYVARYAAKKLSHGKDGEHLYEPIHKTSSKYGIGYTWFKKYWKQTFDNGYVTLPNGATAKIPRYYKDKLKEENPAAYIKYQTEVLPKIIKRANELQKKEEEEFLNNLKTIKKSTPQDRGLKYPHSRGKIKTKILELKFKQLMEQLKL